MGFSKTKGFIVLCMVGLLLLVGFNILDSRRLWFGIEDGDWASTAQTIDCINDGQFIVSFSAYAAQSALSKNNALSGLIELSLEEVSLEKGVISFIAGTYKEPYGNNYASYSSWASYTYAGYSSWASYPSDYGLLNGGARFEIEVQGSLGLKSYRVAPLNGILESFQGRWVQPDEYPQFSPRINAILEFANDLISQCK